MPEVKPIRLAAFGLALFLLSSCSNEAAAAECERWQTKVREAYKEWDGGALRYINLISDEQVASEVKGRPPECPVPKR
jgi:hypothetical protein